MRQRRAFNIPLKPTFLGDWVFKGELEETFNIPLKSTMHKVKYNPVSRTYKSFQYSFEIIAI